MNEAVRMRRENTIVIRDAYKGYGLNYVLKGFNMTVPNGSIYALLGPSGCGKTTLLNCIVGKMELDSGLLEVSLTNKSHLGYMPQTIALYMQLSILETFAYYGRVYGLSWDEIRDRSYQLEKLLELPPEKRIIESLSGGQQRRVSLSVSLIHNPDILILDEPTVGLDPVLSDSIWKYLIKLATMERKTIIITTHYIEEAKQAHMVGLMRGGVLLREETPEDLMSKNDCQTMEEVFLKLSYRQEIEGENKIPDNLPPAIHKNVAKKSEFFSQYRFVAEMVKNWFFIWRNKAMLAFLFGLPLVITLLFNIAIGHNPQGLRLAVINHETPHGAYDCVIDPIGCNFTYPMSCRFLRQLQSSSINIIPFDDLETAKYAVMKNYVWGVVEIPSNYTLSILERLETNIKTKTYAVEHGSVNVWMDMSNQNIGPLLNMAIFESYMKFMGDTFEECGWPRNSIGLPVKYHEPIYGEQVANLNHYASPAIILLLIFYLPMSYTIGVLVQEKILGVLERSMVAGVNLLEVFISHTVIQIIILTFQTAIAMTVLYYIYESPFIGDPFSTALLLLLQGVSGISFGFLIAMTFDRMYQATFASLGSVFSYFFLSGMIWPQQGAHFLLRFFRWVVPVSYSVESLRALTAKGWPITHPLVFKGFISVTGWILAFCLMAHIVLRLRRGNFGSQ